MQPLLQQQQKQVPFSFSWFYLLLGTLWYQIFICTVIITLHQAKFKIHISQICKPMSHIMYNFPQRKTSFRADIVFACPVRRTYRMPQICSSQPYGRHNSCARTCSVYFQHLSLKYTKPHRNYTIFYTIKTITPLNNVKRGNLLIMHKITYSFFLS